MTFKEIIREPTKIMFISILVRLWSAATFFRPVRYYEYYSKAFRMHYHHSYCYEHGLQHIFDLPISSFDYTTRSVYWF